jgi:hypothetical protein
MEENMTVQILNFTEDSTGGRQSAENFIFTISFSNSLFLLSVTDSNVSIPQPFLNSWKHF